MNVLRPARPTKKNAIRIVAPINIIHNTKIRLYKIKIDLVINLNLSVSAFSNKTKIFFRMAANFIPVLYNYV